MINYLKILRDQTQRKACFLIWRRNKNGYIIKKNVHFAKLSFLITSSRFCDNEQVRPVPSGSTRTFVTLLSSTTIAYLNEKNRIEWDLFFK
jgi:hypothetical protein